MKVAISLPDRLFKAAEQTVKRLGVPRSRLYSVAIEAYLKTQQVSDVTERLNRVYGMGKNARDRALLAYNLRMLKRSHWSE